MYCIYWCIFLVVYFIPLIIIIITIIVIRYVYLSNLVYFIFSKWSVAAKKVKKKHMKWKGCLSSMFRYPSLCIALTLPPITALLNVSILVSKNCATSYKKIGGCELGKLVCSARIEPGVFVASDSNLATHTGNSSEAFKKKNV